MFVQQYWIAREIIGEFVLRWFVTIQSLTMISENQFGNDEALKARLCILDGQGNYGRGQPWYNQSTPPQNTFDAWEKRPISLSYPYPRRSRLDHTSPYQSTLKNQLFTQILGKSNFKKSGPMSKPPQPPTYRKQQKPFFMNYFENQYIYSSFSSSS